MQGITRAARSLRDAVADGAHNLEAREDMAVASVMSGLCLANAKLGAWARIVVSAVMHMLTDFV
jgi:alcohol dehydrogenase class IV